jgi:hypothetical protein
MRCRCWSCGFAVAASHHFDGYLFEAIPKQRGSRQILRAGADKRAKTCQKVYIINDGGKFTLMPRGERRDELSRKAAGSGEADLVKRY